MPKYDNNNGMRSGDNYIGKHTRTDVTSSERNNIQGGSPRPQNRARQTYNEKLLGKQQMHGGSSSHNYERRDAASYRHSTKNGSSSPKKPYDNSKISRMMGAVSGRSRSAQRKLPAFIKFGVIAILALLGTFYILAAIMLGGTTMKKVDVHWNDPIPSEVSDMSAASKVNVETILLIGADGSGEAGSRSDTIMYASLNKLTGKLRLCSVLRDCYVEVPGHGGTKINAAFSYGSDELCMRTLENNLRIRTKKYIRVDMDAITVFVDELGGVELELTENEAKALNKEYGKQVAHAGKQKLAGRYAMSYARIRKIDDDFHRVSRQRTLLEAISRECRKTSPTKLLSAMNKAAPHITTNIGSAKLATLGAQFALAMGTGRAEQMSIPVDGSWSYKNINGQSCIKIDLRKNAEAAQEFILFKD